MSWHSGAGAIGQRERLEARVRLLEQAVQRSETDRLAAVARLVEAERLERRRIAGELHDDTVQVLAAAMLSLDRISRLGAGPAVDALVDEVRTMIAAATERTRLLTFELRPPRLASEGLRHAVSDLAEQAARETGATFDVQIGGARYAFVVEEIAYRTFQELISNVRKHSAATAAGVSLTPHGGVLVGIVSDNGRGFDVDRALAAARLRMHMGLAAMEERLSLAGGSVSIRSRAGAGTTVEFRLPLAQAAAARRRPVLAGAPTHSV
jgi:signal transduction histidine kinase